MELKKGDVCSLEVVVDEVWSNKVRVNHGYCMLEAQASDLTLLRRAPVDLATCEIPKEGVPVLDAHGRGWVMLARHGNKAAVYASPPDGGQAWLKLSEISPLDATAPAPVGSFAFRNENGDVQHQETPTCPPGHIMIGDRAVPEPMREVPAVGTLLNSIVFSQPYMTGTICWDATNWQLALLSRGLIHSTEANARAHAEAIIALSAGEGV